ncbi:MAG: type I glutamate--ammonia ligase [bacterium]|nr:type I glutamate--ammonia ligase [bacterium]
MKDYPTGKKLTKEDVIRLTHDLDIKILRLQFTDILGGLKNVGIPGHHIESILDDGVRFDGSSIEGFVRIEESDMRLMPDPATFAVLPWKPEEHREARMICSVVNPDGSPFIGDPRSFLQKMIRKANELGLEMMAGPEAEFFLFERGADGEPTTKTHDKAGYFDLTPVDRGEDARRDIVTTLEAMGFEVEASHHECGYGQHEIDFKYADAMKTADQVVTFRMVVKTIALKHNLHATFMPKPVYGIAGSGMHLNQSLFRNGENIFFNPETENKLSETCLHYIGGLMKHARAFTAFTNPLINSYKRLVPGHEAPLYVCWAEKNRSPMIRIPAPRGKGTRVEMRSPDPSCNPYLAIGLMLCAGLDGIEHKLSPGEPMNCNIYNLDEKDLSRNHIKTLPSNLYEALQAFEQDELMMRAIGPHIWGQFKTAKMHEWDQYRTQVHQWELDRYLSTY